MSESTKHLRPYGTPTRGVSATDVERAADELLRSGERPTVEKIRAMLGTGSPNTVNPLLDSWWKRLANRLDAGPAAFHRLPEAVAHIAESLWMQALEEARRRALLELGSDRHAIDQAKDGYEVRSHVLSLREGEMDARLRERERAYTELEAQLRTLTTLLKKEQKTREVQTREVVELEAEVKRLRALRETKSKSRRRNSPARKAKRRIQKKKGASKPLRKNRRQSRD